jgi:hypothetical protein
MLWPGVGLRRPSKSRDSEREAAMGKQLVKWRGWLVGSRCMVLLAIGMLWALPATARDLPVILVGIVEPPQLDRETGLFVGDVESLYDVLDKLWNDPATLGLASSSVTIQLAENAIYRLDPTKPEAGRVKLPFGTALAGGNQYTDDRDEDGHPGADGIPDAIGVDAMGKQVFASQETILDGRGLTGTRAVVEAGLESSIRNLTVWGARGSNAPDAEIRLLLTDENKVGSLEVDGVICEKGRRGIQVVADNFVGTNGAQLYLTARRSIVRDHTDPVDIAWGIQLNTGNVSGTLFSAILHHNRVHNNRIGIFLASLRTHDGELLLNSHHNVIEENGSGITSQIRDFIPPQGSLRNRTRIHSVKDMIWNNSGGGVNIEGYRRDSNGVEIRDNETELHLLGTRFVKLTASGAFDGLQNRRANRRTDLRIVGAVLASPGLTGPTSDISVRLSQRHTQSSLMPTTYDSAPQPIFIDDNAPDVVDITVIGSQRAYMRTNEGANELDESLFARR